MTATTAPAADLRVLGTGGVVWSSFDLSLLGVGVGVTAVDREVLLVWGVSMVCVVQFAWVVVKAHDSLLLTQSSQ
jgi:hypothetical protein